VSGYSGTPLAKKLGLAPGMRVLVAGAPGDWRALVDPPAQVTQARAAGKSVDVFHLFATSRTALADRLARWRRAMRDDAVVWVSWPKRGSGVATDVTENVVRDIALPIGLVDVKVCAVDGTWSGLKLVVRREHRAAKRTGSRGTA